MEVVSINKVKKNKQDEEQKKAMLEVIDHLKTSIESGEIKEFVAASISAVSYTHLTLPTNREV